MFSRAPVLAHGKPASGDGVEVAAIVWVLILPVREDLVSAAALQPDAPAEHVLGIWDEERPEHRFVLLTQLGGALFELPERLLQTEPGGCILLTIRAT
ncbi:hypothetical protein AB0323_00895 [Arthrobacter sp. NPDC080031]|uniref:hypothetical protein n=1 Tax=Arthrobacter sp. NPDC080031 TaxID=3155918 RepID=UPI00344DFCC8